MDEILQCDHSMKAIEQYFPVVLFIMLYKTVLPLESTDEFLHCDHSNAAIEQYFTLLLFVLQLYCFAKRNLGILPSFDHERLRVKELTLIFFFV